MKKWLLGLVCVGMFAATAMGAQSIADGTPVTQDFDAIGTNALATLPTDWKVDKQLTARTVGTFAAAVTATERVDGQNVSSTAGNGIYNLGAPTDDAVDRAIGWLSSSSATKSGNLYVEMVNAGASAITNLFISYNVEKYRTGTNPAGYQIQLYYSTDGSTWTSAGAAFLTAFPADTNTLGYATPPGATVPVSGNLDLSATPIAASANVYLAWSYSVQSGTTTSYAQLLGVDDVSIALAGSSTPSISFSAAVASVDESSGTNAVLIVKNMAEGDVSGEIVLSGTATEGVDFTVDTTNFTINGATTSATINVAIIDDGDQEADETVVLALANVAGANVLVPNVFTLTINPSDIPTHAIAITPPTNGTVTTTPADLAAEGATVTVNTTPDAGYRVASIVVVDEGLNPVAVTGNTFVMPTAAVTVTVVFEVYVAPDTLIDFETVSGFSSYTPGTSTVSGILIEHDGALRGTTTSDRFHGTAAARVRYLSTNAGYFANAEAFAQPISKISFWHADYGADNTATFKVQVSQDGSSWTDMGAYDPASTTLVEEVIESIPANMTYVQFLTTGGDADRVNIDDVGIWFGAATFNVTFDRTGGFAVTQGVSEAITATAANGTEPYGYSWSSTLGGAYYTAVDNVFTILATAPVGDYSATVVATDGTAASVTNSINFSVKAPYAITITTPTNGTVSTTPAGQAIEGTTVAITATPDASYLVSTITVLDETMTPAPVVGNTFVMPASPVTVTVEFVYHEPSDLIISEVADPSNNATGGRFVELYNAGSSSIDLAAGSWYLARQINGGTVNNIALTGTVAAGSTYVIAGSTNFPTAYPTSPAPNQTSGTVDGNGDDGYFLFSGGSSVSGILEDAHGVIGQDGTGTAWEYTDRRAFRNNGVFQGNPTWTASEWTIPAVANTEDMTPGVHPEGAVVPSVSIVGDTTGTVGVQMNYTITLQNGTASSWDFILKDPADGDVVYNWDSGTGAFSFTPAMAGSYYLSATALDAGALPIASNSVTPSVSAPADVDIPPVTLALNGTGNFLFTVPGGYSLGTVYGADTVVTGAALVFSNLTAGVHYTVSGSNVTITTVSGSRQIIRIGLTSP